MDLKVIKRICFSGTFFFLRLPRKPFLEPTLQWKQAEASSSENELHLHHAAQLPFLQVSNRGHFKRLVNIAPMSEI